ncbi:MAG TPA: RAD55 family ATPase [Thermoplasmata archaeon]|nr:RAD55 family ATPase [Thermoplasmata archaeon]
MDKVQTWVRGYDEELGGGIPAGSVVLVRGASGTMKSSLAYSILYQNALRGRNGLYVTLEQDALSLLDQMRELGLKPESVSEALPLLDLSRGREVLESLRARAGTTSGTPATLAGVLREKIAQLRAQTRFELLAIDSWDALELVLEFEDRRAETFEFFRWLRSTGATSFLVSEDAPVPDPGDFSEEFLADAIFYLKLERVSDLDFQRRLQCAKMRACAHSSDFFTLVFENGRFEVARAIA